MTLRNLHFGLTLLPLLAACGDSGATSLGTGATGSGGSTTSSTSDGSTSTTTTATSSTASGAGGGGGAGLCAGVTCAAMDACHTVGTCDPTSGTCSNPQAPDTTACAGPNVCTSATCQAGVCTAGATIKGAVDQSELVGSVGPFIESSPSTSIGETFVAGATGHLTGIEVSLANCASPPNGTIRLDLRDAAHTVLASASLSPSAFTAGCAGGNLSATTVSGAYFDLSSTCVNVTSGDSLEFELFAVGFPVANCTGIPETCSDGPNAGGTCSIVNACSQYRINVGENADGTSYAGGKEIQNGSTGNANHDIAFKTFIE